VNGRSGRFAAAAAHGVATLAAWSAALGCRPSAPPPQADARPATLDGGNAGAGDARAPDAALWRGDEGSQGPWQWTTRFAHPQHVSLVRARFGDSPARGVPTALRWEALLPPRAANGDCSATLGAGDTWIELAREPVPESVPLRAPALAPAREPDPAAHAALPTHRSWFVDAGACGLRLSVDRTNAGPPVLRSLTVVEGAEDVLRGARASDDGAFAGFSARAAVDGTYAGRWAGAPHRAHWSLRVDLDDAVPIDRIGLVLGFDATSVPRARGGRAYAIAWGPVRYDVQTSEDGEHFDTVASEPDGDDGAPLPVRRRLVRLGEPRRVRALRVVMSGATGADGVARPAAVPVVREVAAYRADDPRPVIAPPWVLSINANPSGQSRTTPGGEMCNDAYHAKFLQARFRPLLPALAKDDRFARALGPRGEALDAPPSDEAGEVLESIEGDDPLLGAHWLLLHGPLPIAVLSGSNDWDYAAQTGPDRAHPKRWHWNPLDDATGMGRLAPVVQGRAAPLIGYCGGAQLLAVLEAEARAREAANADVDAGTRGRGAAGFELVDRVVRRNDGHAVRGFGPSSDLVRSWPTDVPARHTLVRFLPDDALFADVAALGGRSATRELPELHSDAIRPDAFSPGAALDRFHVIASSAFCGPTVAATGDVDGVFPAPGVAAWCTSVPEAFEARDGRWPVIGAQFHAEQRDFSAAAGDDPPESIADPFLFFAAAYDEVVGAMAAQAP
jgi:hypothetical protein